METKRIIFLASEKGGVGKSTVAAHIIVWALTRGLRVVGIDPDDANHTLVRLLQVREGETWAGAGSARPVPVRLDGVPLCVAVNVDADDSLDVVYHQLVSPDTDLVVVDGVGSQHRRTIMKWCEEVSFFDVARSIPADITFVLVIEEDADVYAQALRLMTEVNDKVSWVIVKNEKQHRKWPLWEQTKARVKAAELGAAVIRLGQMQGNIARALQDLNVSLGVAEGAMPDVLNAQRVKTLWRGVCQELDQAAAFLLPNLSGAESKKKK